jgi:large subunit ribosomal protein L29
MKANELRALAIGDLLKKDKEMREDLFKLRFKHGIRRLENSAKLAEVKKDIARVQTVLAEKKINQPN